MRSIVALAVVCLFASAAMADNWPRFRGPNGHGFAQDSDIPSSWSEADLAWKIELSGKGHSSPVIWDDTVYVTSADEEAKVASLLAVRASDGSTMWKRDYAFEPLKLHALNSHASSTPAVDEQGVYTLWFVSSQSLAIAVDHRGEELWRRELGPMATTHGPGLSPIVYEGALIFSLEHERNADVQSRWYGLDLASGETVWSLDRETGESASSSAPCVYRSPAVKEWVIFTSRAHGITAINPQDGTIAWEEKSALPARAVSSPVLAKDLIVATCGVSNQGTRLTAVRPADGPASAPQVVHSIEERFVPYVPTPIAVDDLLFLYHDRGEVTCIEIESGKTLWSERPGGKFYGSPVLVEDRLYCIDTSGQVVVLRAAASYERLAINDLGEASHATPAVANGRMILRTNSRLSCIAASNGQ
ncbi:MAG: PQQ-binding-like beta-propeller repeat protein [Candidatus Hydrogenedentes bacterium]|nr:PQQ-binding-like beta-propeller repeat protein [Candidatus Hydrogenedentota bacterium]